MVPPFNSETEISLIQFQGIELVEKKGVDLIEISGIWKW
jgi:hypothetical protein